MSTAIAKPGTLSWFTDRTLVEFDAANAHRGRIWAENDPAGGARFTFTLPLGTPPKMAYEDDE